MRKEKVSRIVKTLALSASVLLFAAAFVAQIPTRDQWVAAIFFGLFGLLASLLGYSTANGTTGTIGFLPFLSVALVSPNYAAMVSVALSVGVSEVLAKREKIKAVFNISQQVSAQGLAILTYVALEGKSVLEENPQVLAFVVMVAVFFVANKLAVSAVVSASQDQSIVEHWKKSMRASVGYDVFAFPLILIFSLAYRQFGPEWSLLFAVPMLGVRQLYKQNFALQKINEELLQLMVAAIEARDDYTSGHSQRVARYVKIIAKAAKLNTKQSGRIETAALLHDVGKIHEEFGPILRKAGSLSHSEFEIMKTHPRKGALLVGKVSHFADLVAAIESHHESWDGKGYPSQLAGNDIPMAARIIAIADTIDAMGTTRPYRPALDPEIIQSEIRRQAGKQFDPTLCAVLLRPDTWEELLREMKAAAREHPEGSARVWAAEPALVMS